MKIFASYDADGNITAFRNLPNTKKIPAGEVYIEITKAQQDRYFQDPSTCRIRNGEFIDNFVDPMAASMRENARVADIKRAAAAKITETVPEWKQRNMLARSIELLEKGVFDGLTPPEKAELAENRAVWDRINDIRDKSNAAERDGTQPGDIVW